VLLNEPSRTQYDLHFDVLGIPVRVHPFFWVGTLLLGLRGNPKPADMLFWIGAVFFSILIHEMGHALAARYFGWQPQITLHGFGGLASYQPTYRNPTREILITLAGPVAGFLFAAVIVGVIAVSGHEVEFDWEFGNVLPIRWEFFESHQANMLVFDLLFINIFWGLVNLLPVFPLDGGQIAREVLGLVNPHDGLRQSLWLSIITAAVIAILALTKLGDQFLAFFFGYLAYLSYQSLQANFGSGGGLGGYR
jgi:stage IV sporulation protein FB